jgi:Fe-S-cluster-containing hydrogenase component 2
MSCEVVMRISVDAEKCTGCHICEMVCSLHHEGVINLERSAIRVSKDDFGEITNTPVVCRQCKKMVCLASHTEADQEEHRGKYKWDDLSAIENCPFDAVFAFNGVVMHCDLCGGEPRCVQYCSVEAITFESGDGDAP